MNTLISTCKDCGKEFQLSPGAQIFYLSKNLQLPKRCKNCRKKRKEEKAEKDRIRTAGADEKTLQALLEMSHFLQIQLADLPFSKPNKSLVIIGNGFDLMHGVKSSYLDFQKSIGKNSPLRFDMEMYLKTGDLWSNLEDSLGRLDYSMFLNPEVLDMWLTDFGAYDPEAQAADFCAAVETAIAPTFNIPRELKERFRKWIKTLKVENSDRPFEMLHGDYKVLNFNYTEFIETLYGAKRENICYIHGCRKTPKGCKPDEIILGHKPGMEEEQWNKVRLIPYKFKNPYKRYIMEAAIDLAATEASWYDEETTKKCEDIIKNHQDFFAGLSGIEDVYVIGHSLFEVDLPYFQEVCKKCGSNVHWYIGYHSLADMQRLMELVKKISINKVTVFKT